MKKLALLALVLLVAISLFACNISDTDDTTAQTTATETEADTTTAEETTTTDETTTAVEDTTDVTTEETTTESVMTSAEDTEDETEDIVPPEINTISIEEAIEICMQNDEPTTERYYISATVVSVDNAAYGQMTIGDATGTLSVYRTDNEDGSVNYSQMTDKPYKGDEVLLWCTLQNFNGTPEVKSAYLISFKSNQGDIDDSEYTSMSIEDAREAEKGEKVKVEGVVAAIAYANGMKPCGVILIEEQGYSIYVYGADVAQRVSVGNKITVLATKTYWVLEKESADAAKWGYQGACQLEDATLFANDGNKNDIPTENLYAGTMKELMECPVDGPNITSQTIKVNALISKQENPGFVNYYIYDIDGKTGSYVYTQCNGSDFAWLDEFDGKICTVYLTAINAKSTSTGCIYRLLPVMVIDEGYTFDAKDAPEYALIYHALTQFTSTEFSADPAMELIASVSSELLGFENVKISYASDNDAVKIFNENGKPVMHCIGEGEATVTITAELNGVTATKTITIKSTPPKEIDSVSVADAIKAEVGETVTVRGIVGTSVINKTGGFYLIGENEIIAVILNSADDIKGLTIGDEIIITGMRDRFIKDGKTMHGQTCITAATVEANYYGDNGYVMGNLAVELTPEEFYDLDENVDLTTNVYRFTATASVSKSAYSTNVYLKGTDNTKSVSLYSGNAYQYAWMADFDGKTITVDIAACNWNSKDYYRGCILAVYVDGERVAINDYNFGE